VHHIPALLAAWPFEEVLIWARRSAAAEELAGRTRKQFALAARCVASPRDAARADVICTLTSAQEPFLLGEWISAGTHINLVGSSFAGPREVDSALIASARYFVDSTESAMTHASELLYAMKSGLVAPTHILGELGAVLEGRTSGRISETDITVYKSLGHIAQDLAVGSYLYERAMADGFGTVAAF
jgi:ornithine cyclodeaminase